MEKIYVKEDLLIAALLLILLLIFQISAIFFENHTNILVWSGITPILHYLLWFYWAFKLGRAIKNFKELKKEERIQNEKDQSRK